MNNKLFSFVMFTTGAAIGSLVTWKAIKTKYERLAQEEIDSVKEEFSRLSKIRKESNDRQNEDEDAEAGDIELNGTDQDNLVEYNNITARYRSSSDDDETDEEGDEWSEGEVPYINGPYVISPDDFASSPPGYSAQPLDYFADGILADGWGVELDIEETIGEESLEHFGEYADDLLYVRNERKEIDYEVTKDPRTYAEAVQTNPNSYYGR